MRDEGEARQHDRTCCFRLDRARDTLEALHRGIVIEGDHSPRAATLIVARIFAEADRLGEFPQLGRVGVVPGTYEWTVSGLPYIIVHEVDDDKDQIVVIGDFHGAQAP